MAPWRRAFLSLCVTAFISFSLFPHDPSSAEEIIASWYEAGHTMANGDPFDRYDASTAAHRTLPFGTVLQVTNLRNGMSIVVVVRDRGPYIDGRSIDLSYGAAWLLDFVEEGLVPVSIKVLSGLTL